MSIFSRICAWLQQIEADTRPSMTSNIWDQWPFNTEEFQTKLQEAERENVRQWNEVCAQEAKAHREGRQWDWSRYSGQQPAVIQAMAEADGHAKPTEAEAKPWRDLSRIGGS